MPKMKEVRHYRRATDHRAIVLEVVATIPVAATRDAVQKEVEAEATKMAYSGFHKNAVSAMVSELLREGLIGRKEDGTLFVTSLGLDWMVNASFDRALPSPHTKPKRKKQSKK